MPDPELAPFRLAGAPEHRSRRIDRGPIFLPRQYRITTHIVLSETGVLPPTAEESSSAVSASGIGAPVRALTRSAANVAMYALETGDLGRMASASFIDTAVEGGLG